MFKSTKGQLLVPVVVPVYGSFLVVSAQVRMVSRASFAGGSATYICERAVADVPLVDEIYFRFVRAHHQVPPVVRGVLPLGRVHSERGRVGGGDGSVAADAATAAT